MDLGIAGKVALVTGSARSLGKADAVMLAAEGCKVAIVDLNAEGAEETAREIAGSGAQARGYACDIRDTGQVQETVARIERELGPVDICVNNAGMIYTVGQLKDMRDEDWEFNLGVNLTGTMKVTRAVFSGMREPALGERGEVHVVAEDAIRRLVRTQLHQEAGITDIGAQREELLAAIELLSREKCVGWRAHAQIAKRDLQRRAAEPALTGVHETDRLL